VPPVPTPLPDVLRTCTPPADPTVFEYPGSEVQPGHTEGNADSDEVMNSPTLPRPEELSPIQPMEQEATESNTAAATEARLSVVSRPTSVEMESPAASQGVPSSQRDQPEGEHCSPSDSVPSLAAALMELHELLASNNRAPSQNHSTACSPSHPFDQETKEATPEPRTPMRENIQLHPSTAISAGEPNDAKAHHAAAVSAEGPSKCLVADLSGPDAADTAEGHGPPRCPDGSVKRRGDAVNNISRREPEVPPDPARDLEFREPPEGQQGRGVADGTNTPDTPGLQTEDTLLGPPSLAVGSREEVSSASPPSPTPLAQAPPLPSPAPPPSPASLLPSPHLFIGQFPAEHIQRIQAAGFSARAAAEALEQAHGVVELALLALLARSITVPAKTRH